MAASPGHPVLKRVIDILVERAASGWRFDIEWWVIYHTGPNAWTWAIIDILGLEEELAPFCPKEKPGSGNYWTGLGALCGRELAKRVWTEQVAYERARQHKICIMGPRLWSWEKPLLVKHHGAGGDPQHGWVQEQSKFFQALESIIPTGVAEVGYR